MKDLILKLYSLGMIKFGDFEIKKNFHSPFQIDLSRVISFGSVAKEISFSLWSKAKHLSFELISGVPLCGACFANFIAWEREIPLVLKLNETKKLSPKIVGSYRSGQRCLVFQDLFLSGQHTFEMVEDLNEEGIEVRDVVAFIDLGLGGKKKMKTRNLIPHSVIEIEEILQILVDSNKIGGDQYKLAIDFLENV